MNYSKPLTMLPPVSPTTPYRSPPGADGRTSSAPHPVVEKNFPGLPSSRWVSQRLLTADDAVIDAVRSGELGRIGDDTVPKMP
ncbi:MAG: hypothetical protein CM1200mP25_4530 [Acidobacteriota bacterium]|nr:MAG: hypothetical protein CM1200mP25_4530 [Acidobacteriota bacterium]